MNVLYYWILFISLLETKIKQVTCSIKSLFIKNHSVLSIFAVVWKFNSFFVRYEFTNIFYATL